MEYTLTAMGYLTNMVLNSFVTDMSLFVTLYFFYISKYYIIGCIPN